MVINFLLYFKVYKNTLYFIIFSPRVTLKYIENSYKIRVMMRNVVKIC
jgi:hypothetical protein